VIAVVDYGVSNLASVVRAVRAAGHAAELVADPDQVRQAERVVLPGVGNFGHAARTLASTGLGQAVLEVAASGRPIMGICLGLQLFFELSEEAPGAAGLSLLPGRVQRFSTTLPVPHVGWARVDLTASGCRHTLLRETFRNRTEFFYHVHSYHPAELPGDVVLATGSYGSVFPTIAGSGSVIGVQFHPEKSQTAGLSLLSAFAAWRP
jgi:glutamine amidotransferase